jgi:hypothetical protein
MGVENGGWDGVFCGGKWGLRVLKFGSVLN